MSTNFGVRVRCVGCRSITRRIPANIVRGCVHCGGELRETGVMPGHPFLPPERKRRGVNVHLLPATVDALAKLGARSLSAAAASLLDAWARDLHDVEQDAARGADRKPHVLRDALRTLAEPGAGSAARK